jgi:hypothetical protein
MSTELLDRNRTDVQTGVTGISCLPRNVELHLPVVVRNSLAQMDQAHQEEFAAQYKLKGKSPAKAYLFWLFGCHYLYLGQPNKALLYWLTLGGAGIWMVLDAFRMGALCGEASRDTAIDVCRIVGQLR